MVLANLLLKGLIVSISAFKNFIGTLSLSSAIEAMILIANPLSTKTLLEGQESTKGTLYKVGCFGLSGGQY